MEKELKGVSDEDLAASYAVPTVVVNRYLVSTNPNSFRIAFGETMVPNTAASYRIAVQLTPWEAKELKEILEALLKPFETQLQTMEEALQSGQPTNK